MKPVWFRLQLPEESSCLSYRFTETYISSSPASLHSTCWALAAWRSICWYQSLLCLNSLLSAESASRDRSFWGWLSWIGTAFVALKSSFYLLSHCSGRLHVLRGLEVWIFAAIPLRRRQVCRSRRIMESARVRCFFQKLEFNCCGRPYRS